MGRNKTHVRPSFVIAAQAMGSTCRCQGFNMRWIAYLKSPKKRLSRSVMLLFLRVSPCLIIVWPFLFPSSATVTLYKFVIVATPTFMPSCEDLAQAYIAVKSGYSEKYNITCVALDAVPTVNAVNASAPGRVNITAANGARLTEAESDSVALLLMRTPFYVHEAAQFRDFFVQYPLIINSILFGYNLPELDAVNETLRLTRANLVGIYNGSIAYWNDSSFFEGNPYLRRTNGSSVLPRRRIQVGLRNDRYLTTWMLTRILAAFDPKFKEKFGAMGTPNGTEFALQLQPTTRVFLSNKNVGLSLYGYLSTQPYSAIACVQEEVEQYGFRTALIQNKAGFFTTSTEISVRQRQNATIG